MLPLLNERMEKLFFSPPLKFSHFSLSSSWRRPSSCVGIHYSTAHVNFGSHWPPHLPRNRLNRPRLSDLSFFFILVPHKKRFSDHCVGLIHLATYQLCDGRGTWAETEDSRALGRDLCRLPGCGHHIRPKLVAGFQACRSLIGVESLNFGRKAHDSILHNHP